MRYLVARRNCQRQRLKVSAYHGYSDRRLLQTGEPYLLHLEDRRWSNVPLVKLFGPGHYWMVRKSLVDLAIVGEGLDNWDGPDEMRQVFSLRRKGRIWGKWFSRYVPDGEHGIYHMDEVDMISAETFFEAINAFRQGKEPR